MDANFRKIPSNLAFRFIASNQMKRNKQVFFSFFSIIVIIIRAIPGFGAESGISWTEDELAFIKAHPVIRLGVDPGFVPFEFIENGEYKGIAADYLALISEKTGLEFEVAEGLTWPEAYDMALAGYIDALPAVGKTEDREKHFLYSEPYYYYKRVIVTRDTDTRISAIEDLYGYTVAVQRNSSHHSYLLSHPKINLSLYDSVEAALTAVATGEEKAFIGNLATTNYIIRSTGLTSLRFVSFEAEKQQALYFAVRKDWPELVSIINKALNSISESEKLAIHNKWVGLDADLDYGPFIRILAVVGPLIAVILAVSFFWIVRLRKEVLWRKQIQLDLEKANEFKSHFLARMSHEIRTPLNAVTGLAYLLKKTEVTLTQNMYLDRIVQAANNMLSIINDILDFSKIEAGKVQLEITSFSLDRVIQDVINIVSYQINEKGIAFRLYRDPLIPDWFYGDSRRIEQVLLNVLNNAVKFTSQGKVSLDVKPMAKENDKYYISFTIKDTGIGMTKEQMDKLFAPFEQGDTSINRRFGGSGLGLSIVKNLVDLMKGEMKVFSAPGEGTTFNVQLPLDVDRKKEEAYIKAMSASRLRDVRILVLDKSDEDTNLIKKYLASHGIHCEAAHSEEEAVSMLKAADGKHARPFDLFIIEYGTPAEGGFNFIEKIRYNIETAKFPKPMMLFPMMREDLFDKLNEHGIHLGIEKPILPSILLNGIINALNPNTVLVSHSSAARKSSLERLERSYLVLLAEDNETNQLIAKTLLEQAGFGVIIAKNGKEAVEHYKKHRNEIDLILMDLHMPVMNGYEAAEQIREMSAQVPIIALTADVVSDVNEKCVQSGIFHYISKPFHPEHFIQTVEKIILENKHKAGMDRGVLNRQLGLKNMGGNEKLYNQVLQEYYKENRDTLGALKAAIREKRYADAAQIVHKIKSSSGSIGAKSVQDAAGLLQRVLEEKNEKEITLMHDRFSKLMRELFDELTTN